MGRQHYQYIGIDIGSILVLAKNIANILEYCVILVYIGLHMFGIPVIFVYIGSPKVAQKWPRDINTEMVTKIVAVRAVNLSTGPFCTEFRCEQLCDDVIFWDRGQLLGPET